MNILKGYYSNIVLHFHKVGALTRGRFVLKKVVKIDAADKYYL